MLNDYLKNIKNILQLEIRKEALKNEIDDKRALVYNVHKILKHIIDNYMFIARYDRTDKQSMCNIIGVSIAVCAIVTLCIALLITVHNKNQANTKVKLLN